MTKSKSKPAKPTKKTQDRVCQLYGMNPTSPFLPDCVLIHITVVGRKVSYDGYVSALPPRDRPRTVSKAQAKAGAWFPEKHLARAKGLLDDEHTDAIGDDAVVKPKRELWRKLIVVYATVVP